MKVNCPRCQVALEMKPDMYGQKWRCRECGQKIRINAPAGGQARPAGSQKKSARKPAVAAGRPSERKKAVRASQRREEVKPRRQSQRRNGVNPEEEGEGAPPKISVVSNDQAVYMIGGFLIVFIIFGFMLFNSGKSNKKKKKRNGVQKVAHLSPFEALVKQVEDQPDDRFSRRKLIRMLLDKDNAPMAYQHVSKLLDEDDMEAYALGVETCLRLDKRSEADLLAEKAETFDPNGMEPIHKAFAADLRRRGLESKQALEVEGMAAALDIVEQGMAAFKKGQEENPQFKVASDHFFKGLETLEKAQETFPYNLWIEKKIVYVNKHLMWANKMYRDVSDEDKARWDNE